MSETDKDKPETLTNGAATGDNAENGEKNGFAQESIPLNAYNGGGDGAKEQEAAAAAAAAADVNVVLKEPSVPFPSCRLVLTAMAVFCFINVYCIRVDLSVAIVAMVNQTYIKELATAAALEKNTNSTTGNEEVVCEVVGGNSTSSKQAVPGIFNWNTNLQGIILGSFFYGYITTQFFGGVMAQKFGGKRLLLFAVAFTSILTLLTPVLTRAANFPALIVIRVLEGMGQGISFPCMHALLTKWAPPMERSKMVTLAYAGCQLGTVIAMPISGILAFYSWDGVFYLFGGLGLVWSVMWFFLVYESPAVHPRIHPAERQYIEAALGTQSGKKTPLKDLPWKSIFTSLPLLAIAVAHFTNNWGYYTMLTCLPTYFSNILKFDLKSNGALAALPYLACWIFMICGGLIADFLRTKKILSTTNVRKLINAVGFLGPAACFIAAGYIECDSGSAVACIVMAVGLSGISWAGWSVNHLDLAPPYAGTLMGLTNTLGTVPGFVGPSVAAAFTDGNQTRGAWRKVFFVAAAIYLFGTIFYAIFGSGEKQAWASSQPENSTNKDEEKALKEKVDKDEKEVKS